jgi:hypothetical protein
VGDHHTGQLQDVKAAVDITRKKRVTEATGTPQVQYINRDPPGSAWTPAVTRRYPGPALPWQKGDASPKKWNTGNRRGRARRTAVERNPKLAPQPPTVQPDRHQVPRRRPADRRERKRPGQRGSSTCHNTPTPVPQDRENGHSAARRLRQTTDFARMGWGYFALFRGPQ